MSNETIISDSFPYQLIEVEAQISVFSPSQILYLEELRVEVLAARDESVASAEAANDSEIASAESEVKAKASEVAAKVSEDNSKASELAAKDSETNAAASEAAAKASEDNAKASEGASADSAAQALDSEDNAKASEVAAAASEANAAASETAAKSSEDNSKASETAAKASEDWAYKWAEEAEDVEVKPGEYSAHHWADKAAEHSGSITNGMYFAGRWKLGEGLPPEPVEKLVPWYRVVEADPPPTRSGADPVWLALVDDAHPGDQLCWDPVAKAYFLVDCTDEVWLVNGKKGDVTLSAADVGAGSAADLQGVKDDLATIEGEVTTIQSDVTGLESDVTTLQTDVTTIEGDVTTVEQQAAANKTAFEDHLAADNPHHILVPPPGRLNFLINGDFSIWQRGDSFDTYAAFTSDHWGLQGLDNNKVKAIRNDNAVNLINTDGDRDQRTVFWQRVEMSPKRYSEAPMTLSFIVNWVTKPTTFELTVYWLTPAIAVTGEVVKFSKLTENGRQSETFNLPAAPGDAAYLHLTFIFKGSLNVMLSDVMLTLGPNLYPFAYTPMAEELALCQRYYEKSYARDTVPGTNVGADNTTVGSMLHVNTGSISSLGVALSCLFKVNKFKDPAVTLYSTSGLKNNVASDQGARPALAGGVTDAGFNVYVSDVFTFSAHWTADAEIA